MHKTNEITENIILFPEKQKLACHSLYLQNLKNPAVPSFASLGKEAMKWGLEGGSGGGTDPKWWLAK